jgi:hypothetical protein
MVSERFAIVGLPIARRNWCRSADHASTSDGSSVPRRARRAREVAYGDHPHFPPDGFIAAVKRSGGLEQTLTLVSTVPASVASRVTHRAIK